MNTLRFHFIVGSLVSILGWTMLGLNAWLLRDYEDCQFPKATFDMMIFSCIGLFATIYSAFLLCKIDLIDKRVNPTWHSILNCLLVLLIPCAVVNLILLCLTEVKCREVLEVKTRIFGWFSAGVGTIYSLVFMVTAFYFKTTRLIRESRERKSQEKYMNGIKQLKVMTQLENYNPERFLEVYSSKRATKGPLDSIELAYLLNYCTLKNLSLYPEHSRYEIARLRDLCPICQSDMTNNTSVLSFPGCEHKFDVDCISRWLEQSDCCPMCKGGARECLYDVLSTKPPIEANPMFSPSK